MMLIVADIVAVCIALALYFVLQNRASIHSRLPFPPGPPAEPFLGHLRIMPTSRQYEKFYEWCQQYGDIIRLHVPGSSIIILGSDKVAKALLEKRGINYSSRPPFTVIQLAGWFPGLTFLPYGKHFIKHRKIIQGPLTREESKKYCPIHSREVGKALKSFLEYPSNYVHIFEKYAVGTVVNLSYGHQVEDDDDIFLRFSKTIDSFFNQPGSTGNTIVDHLPMLQHFPSWFPGTHFAHWARKMKPLMNEIFDWPYERLLEQKEGRHQPRNTRAGTVGNWDLDSIVGQLVCNSTQEQMRDPEHVRDIKGIGASIIGAGADTTHVSAEWFLLLMLANPEVQKKGQMEVDAVTGGDRLPTFDDRESLPYIEAIVQEVLRWHPSVATGVPHLTTQDDIFRNMFIPKGSVVIPNIQGISWDERVYKHPRKFCPERFLPKSEGGNGEPPFDAAFGYGRRICPGKWLAGNALWLLCASMLAVFDMVKAKDAEGNEIELTMDFTEGLAHAPVPFASVVKPRSPEAACLIRELS